MIWSRIGFTGSDTQACSGMVRIGSRKPAMRATSLDAPATACTILPARMTPRLVSTPTARPFSIEDPVDARLRVHLDAALDGLLGVAPGDRVVARDGAGRMVERAEDRIAHVVGDVDGRAQPLDLVRPDHLGIDAEMLVDLGAPARRAHRRIRVGEREVAALGIHHVDVELVRQPAEQLDGFLVEVDALGRQIVGADDRGVARGVAAGEPALVEHARRC